MSHDECFGASRTLTTKEFKRKVGEGLDNCKVGINLVVLDKVMNGKRDLIFFKN